MQIKQGAEEFFLPGTNGGAVLLIHGYTGTPAEMRPLGDYLQQLGYTVLGVRLAGHGGSMEDVKNSTAEQWYASAKAGYERLAQQFGSVYVAGLSMGGLVAIRVAAEMGAAKAALMSTPIFVPDKRLPFMWFLKYFVHYLPKAPRSYGELDKYNLCNEKMPVKPLTSLFKLLEACKKRYLPAIKAPVIVLQSKRDHTVVPESAQYIFEHLGSAPESKKLVWFSKSGHIMTLDREREQAYEEIGAFFRRNDKENVL